MKVIGVKLINGIQVPVVIECAGIEVGGSTIDSREFEPDDCRVYMQSFHPALSYFIIKTEKRNNGCYDWLRKAEADAIMKCAAESDVIDLRKFGNYQICTSTKIQTVMIMNDYDEWSEKEIPIVIKLEDDDE